MSLCENPDEVCGVGPGGIDGLQFARSLIDPFGASKGNLHRIAKKRQAQYQAVARIGLAIERSCLTTTIAGVAKNCVAVAVGMSTIYYVNEFPFSLSLTDSQQCSVLIVSKRPYWS